MSENRSGKSRGRGSRRDGRGRPGGLQQHGGGSSRGHGASLHISISSPVLPGSGTEDVAVRRKLEDLSLQNSDSAVDLTSHERASMSSSLTEEDEERPRPLMAQKPAKKGDRYERLEKFRANIWLVNMPPDTYIHRYNVTIKEEAISHKGKPIQKELTKGAADDHNRELKRVRCFQTFVQVVQDNPDFFTNPYALAYDRQKIFYSLDELPVKMNSSKQFRIFDEETNKNVTFTLERASLQPMCLNDFEPMLRQDLSMRTRDTQQFLEILSNQVLFFNENLVQFGRNFVDVSGAFDPKNDLGGGKFLASGASKGARIYEGYNGQQPVMGFQIDLKKIPIYVPDNVLHTMARILECDVRQLNETLSRPQIGKLTWELKGRIIETKSGHKFEIAGISDKGSVDCRVDFWDHQYNVQRSLNVSAFYQEQHNEILEYPKLNCLVEKRKERPWFHPAELCTVCPNQRVPKEKQTAEQNQLAIKKCAIKPSHREAEVKNFQTSTEMLDNPHLDGMGITVEGKQVEVVGRILPKIGIDYQPGTKRVQVNDRGSWEMRGDKKWYLSGKCENWAWVNLDKKCSKQSIREFLDRYLRMAHRTGVNVPTSSYEDPLLDVEQLESYFKWANGNDIEFILFFMPKNKDTAVKDKIKYLEQLYEICTQCVRTPNIMNNGRNADGTLMNIMLKTNMKLGGLNFSMNLDAKTDEILRKWFVNTLFLGVDVNHPPPQSNQEQRLGITPKEPSVIGMVGSSAELVFQYTGEHWFQDPREERILAMQRLVLEFLKRYSNGAETVDKLPRSVIMMRDGVSEGQYKMCLEEEVPAMKRAFKELSAGYKPMLTFLVALKRHNLRLTREDLNPSSQQQDNPVGTVVDFMIVNPANWEFYLQSHAAIQGTAKIPKYCVLHDENEFTQNELEGVIYVLAHNHQICNKSVSLPAPVYGAHEMAERGKRIYRAEMLGSESSSSGCSSDGGVDWNEFSKKHMISGTKLATRKHWA